MKTKRTPTSRLVYVIAGLLIAAVVLIGCVLTAQPALDDLWGVDTVDLKDEAARDALETLWGAPLPSTASTFHYYAYGWQDAVGFGRFSLPAADWEAAFASSTLCFVRPLDDFAVFHLSNEQLDKDWWRPDDATQALTGEQCQGENGAFYTMLVDTSSRETYIVYLNVFTT